MDDDQFLSENYTERIDSILHSCDVATHAIQAAMMALSETMTNISNAIMLMGTELQLIEVESGAIDDGEDGHTIRDSGDDE